MKAVSCGFALLICACAAPLVAAQASPGARQSVRVHQTYNPVFPPAAKEAGFTSGDVRIVINVAADGSPGDWLVVGYTHKSFADAVVIALPRWRYEPMRINGQPADAQIELLVHFEIQGPVVVTQDLNAAMTARVASIESPGYWPATLRQIDALPTPLAAVGPVYPNELADRGVVGSATVEFFIDETGAVRMPAVVRADHPELGPLAVDAVRQWKFEPPKRRGRPTLVRVQQRFDFDRGNGGHETAAADSTRA